jgi:hypothetical protein
LLSGQEISDRGLNDFLWHSKTFSLLSRAMKLLMAFAVWILMAFVLVKGLLGAMHGSFWLLAVGVIGFTALVAKIGCLSHD